MAAMFTLWLVLAAQADADAAGCPPRLMRLQADEAGKIMVTVIVNWKVKPTGVAGNRDGTGTRLLGTFPVVQTVELGDLKELTISTAAGANVALKDARQKLAGGATVVVSGDGKAVSAEFLKVFKDDTLVLVSPELVDARIGGALDILPPLNPPLRK